jgi:hypothetical protein
MSKKIYLIALIVFMIIGIRYLGFDSPKIIDMDKVSIVRPIFFYMSKENKVFFDNEDYLCGINIGCTKQLNIDDDLGRYLVFKSLWHKYLFVGVHKVTSSSLDTRQKAFGAYDFNLSHCKVKKDFNELKKAYSYSILFDMYDISLDSNDKVIINDTLNHICNN